MIYSKSAYSTRLINAAGRLFCLKNSSHNNITINNNTNNNNVVNDVQTSPPTSITSSVKHFCFPLKDSTRQLQKSKQYLSIHREASIESSFYQNTNETNNQNKQKETIIDQPVDVSLVSFTDSSECNKRTKCKDVKFSSYSKVNVHNELDNHITNEMNTNFYSNPINLRRNQSRYRSLRRRQMENLTKRAEWFLQPTILPKLTFTLNQFNNNNDTNTTMSTISLLNIQDKMNNTMTNNHSNMIQVVHPRILFTSSTSDLLIPSNYDHLDTIYCRQPYDETLLDHQKINPTHLYPSYNYGHSFNSLLNHSLLSTTSSPSSNYYVISQSNQLYSSQLNQENHTINSLRIPNLSSEENNTSTHSFLYYNIPKYSLSYHNDYDHINKPDRLQSTSYDNFHILSYSSNHNIHENNNINLINDCNITPTNISSISNTNYTNSTNLSFNVKNELRHNNNKLTSSISGLDIIKKSNMIYSDWSIDRPIKNELSNRYRPRSHSISNSNSSSRHSNNVTKLK
ncbi:unnamed protein product [Schistosoma margrebowiei]|uniref:Uncharacterized protein n=1 Tax=Schistosoma margrebowiei TaxID=48269 RepID=A0A183M6G0_9TREM|nr:unnamed protein product [Schistosoma margrebowiei]